MAKITIRPANRNDIPAINELKSKAKVAHSNDGSVAHIMNSSSISFLVESENKQAIGFVALTRKDKQSAEITSCILSSQCISEVEQVMKKCFETLPDLVHAFLQVNSKENLSPLKSEIKLFKETTKDSKTYLTFERNLLVPPLKVRKCRMEDCDDVMPLFIQNDDPINEYDLSLLLEPSDHNIVSYVASVGKKVIAFVQLTKNVDLERIYQSFQVESFDYFRDEEKGTENLFAIKLFYMEEGYGHYIEQIITSAFSFFPCDFCILTVPNSAHDLDLMKPFFQIPNKSSTGIRHNLYVVNRFENSNIRVQEYNKNTDQKTLVAFLQDISASSASDIIENPNQSSKQRFFVVSLNQEIYGLVIVENIVDLKEYAEQFEVEKYVTVESDTPGLILRDVIMNPLFWNQASFVIEQVLLQTGASCVLNIESDDRKYHGQSIIRQNLTPLMRRRRVEYKDNLRDGVPLAPHIETNTLIATPRLLNEYIPFNNEDVVVIGISNITISLLENLIYVLFIHLINSLKKSGIRFNSITFVSTEDIQEYTANTFDRSFTILEMKQLQIAKFISQKRSTLKRIDRENKRVELSDGSDLNYDYLVISPDVEYDPEMELSGLGSLNNVYSAGETKMKDTSSESGTISIIHGSSLHAIRLVSELLQMKTGGQIYAVIPKTLPGVSDVNARQKMMNIFRDKGVVILEEYSIKSFAAANGVMTAATFKHESKEDVTITGNIDYYYLDKTRISQSLLSVLQEASIVCDERLVVNEKLETSDASILSAGPGVRFSRSTLADFSLDGFNPREIGEKLSKQLLKKMGYKDDGINYKFLRPNFVDLALVDGFRYVSFEIPGLNSSNGSVLSTDNWHEHGFTSTNLSTDGYIQGFCYLGKENVFRENLFSLFGVHEKYLNRLVARFTSKEDEGIKDLKRFFEESWAYLIYYDRFHYFSSKISQAINGSGDSELHAVLSKMKSVLARNGDNSDKSRKEEEKLLSMAFQWTDFRLSLDELVHGYYMETGVCQKWPTMEDYPQ